MSNGPQLRTLDGDALAFAPKRLIIAGYTGRDEDAVREHIAELAAIGVPPPPRVPMYYELDPALLTSESAVTTASQMCSGEVEPVFIRCAGRWYLGVGSDHTDRELERTSICEAKAVCPKPVGAVVAKLPDRPDGVVLDEAIATMDVDGTPYQRGTLVGLRAFADLWSGAMEAVSPGDEDLAMFGGTLPLLAGTFVPGRHWQLRLALPDGRELSHEYEIERNSRS